MKSKRQKAQEVHKQYKKIFADIQIRTRNGDRQAALEVMRVMYEFDRKLRFLGYRTTDDDDYPIKGGTLVRITKKWTEENKKRWARREKQMMDMMPPALRESMRIKMMTDRKKAQKRLAALDAKIARELG